VGYLPLAFAGLDVSLLREGARQSFCDSLEGPARLALRFAELESQGIRAINVLSYSSWLKEMGAWFVQLWGESLGKQKSAVLATGLIPMSSIGATDQHSLLQYLLDGPNQVLNAIVTIKDWPMKSSLLPRVERVPPAFSKQSFLAGHNFAQILKAEAMASFEALRQSERAVFHVEWTHLDALNVGRWMASWMDLTVLTAAALGVNPFDQPGVEKIKTKIPAALIAT
jgi:glucose-6-phosphate isomerase